MAQTRDYVNQSVFRNQPIEQCEASASDFATQPRGQCETRVFEITEAYWVLVGEILHVATLSRRRLSRERLLFTLFRVQLFRRRKVGE